MSKKTIKGLLGGAWIKWRVPVAQEKALNISPTLEFMKFEVVKVEKWNPSSTRVTWIRIYYGASGINGL